jgi:hypothetical protein
MSGIDQDREERIMRFRAAELAGLALERSASRRPRQAARAWTSASGSAKGISTRQPSQRIAAASSGASVHRPQSGHSTTGVTRSWGSDWSFMAATIVPRRDT